MQSPTNFRFFLTAVTLFTSLAAVAQSPSQARPAHPPTQVERRADGSPELVRFERATAPTAAEAPAAMRAALGLSAQNELRVARPAEADELGFTSQRYQQFYQGVPVEFTAYTTHSRAGVVEFMTGETRPLADDAINVHPTLTAAAALPSALAFVHAAKYMWQQPNESQLARQLEDKATYRPVGELVIVDNVLTMDQTRHGKSVLAWKFNIYAAEPLSRAWVYVDAHTGEVVNQDAIIKHATASFTTRYSGTRSLANQLASGGSLYNLRETTRGLGIETYNMKRSNNYGAAVDFFDANNTWTAAEYNNANQDWVAGDAHFGAQQTYDYWKLVHNRNSFNSAGAKIKSYVHYDNTPGDGKGYDNAFWDGSVMTYGDGNTSFRPLSALDVCAHEVGHAICTYTAGLKYQNESGGMNEGFSDIWGACVEARTASLYALAGKSTWLIGEEIMLAGGALRSMSNPNAYGQPDTYKGTNWVNSVATPSSANDYGGVHTNSGVLNYWFYLLSQGGLGTNDKGNTYSVTGVGITNAAKIAYATEKLLSPTSSFSSARTMAIQAATTLYGASSAEVRAVTNAWYAVGIGGGIAYGSTAARFIDLVGLNALSRFSVSDGGYFDGVAAGSTVASIARCSQQTLLHSAGFSGAVSGQYWNVYIDYNQDQDFSDAGERVVTNKYEPTSTWTTTKIIVPSSALLGTTRMRVIMSATATSVTCGSVGSGEVEDYSISITATAAIAAPTGLSAGSVTATSATLQWTNVATVASYNIRYHQVGNLYWAVLTSTTSSKAITGLSGGKTYEFQVQAVNDCGTTGAYSILKSFTTPLVRPAGTAPGAPAPIDSLAATLAATDSALTAARLTGLADRALVTLRAAAYPNPATDVLHLTLTGRDGGVTPTAVEVYDLRGARIQSATYDGRGTLNVAALKPGFYTAIVRDASGARPAPVRFVKE